MAYGLTAYLLITAAALLNFGLAINLCIYFMFLIADYDYAKQALRDQSDTYVKDIL
jgi:hypothetical protein